MFPIVGGCIKPRRVGAVVGSDGLVAVVRSLAFRWRSRYRPQGSNTAICNYLHVPPAADCSQTDSRFYRVKHKSHKKIVMNLSCESTTALALSWGTLNQSYFKYKVSVRGSTALAPSRGTLTRFLIAKRTRRGSLSSPLPWDTEPVMLNTNIVQGHEP